MSNFFQQGDVLFFRVLDENKGVRKAILPSNGRFVLAEGEATGHAHTIAECPEVELYERDGILYCCAAKDVEVNHQEHNTITLPAGTYRIGIVKEYDYESEEIRNVRD